VPRYAQQIAAAGGTWAHRSYGRARWTHRPCVCPVPVAVAGDCRWKAGGALAHRPRGQYRIRQEHAASDDQQRIRHIYRWDSTPPSWADLTGQLARTRPPTHAPIRTLRQANTQAHVRARAHTSARAHTHTHTPLQSLSLSLSISLARVSALFRSIALSCALSHSYSASPTSLQYKSP